MLSAEMKKRFFRLKVKYNPTVRTMIRERVMIVFWSVIALSVLLLPALIIWKLSAGFSGMETLLIIAGGYAFMSIVLWLTDKGFGVIPVRIIK